MSDVKKEKISLRDLCPTICTVVASGGEFLLYPTGKSMLPTIRPEKDGVLLSSAASIEKGDIVLYKRADGSFVLHRIVSFTERGNLVLRGDSQYIDEVGIPPSSVIAKVAAILRDGKREIRTDARAYRTRCKMRSIGYPLRRFAHRAKNKIKRMFKR